MTVRRGGSSGEVVPPDAGKFVSTSQQQRLTLQCPWRLEAGALFSASGPSSFLVTLVIVRGVVLGGVGRERTGGEGGEGVAGRVSVSARPGAGAGPCAGCDVIQVKVQLNKSSSLPASCRRRYSRRCSSSPIGDGQQLPFESTRLLASCRGRYSRRRRQPRSVSQIEHEQQLLSELTLLPAPWRGRYSGRRSPRPIGHEQQISSKSTLLPASCWGWYSGRCSPRPIEPCWLCFYGPVSRFLSYPRQPWDRSATLRAWQPALLFADHSDKEDKILKFAANDIRQCPTQNDCKGSHGGFARLQRRFSGPDIRRTPAEVDLSLNHITKRAKYHYFCYLKFLYVI